MLTGVLEGSCDLGFGVVVAYLLDFWVLLYCMVEFSYCFVVGFAVIRGACIWLFSEPEDLSALLLWVGLGLCCFVLML